MTQIIKRSICTHYKTESYCHSVLLIRVVFEIVTWKNSDWNTTWFLANKTASLAYVGKQRSAFLFHSIRINNQLSSLKATHEFLKQVKSQPKSIIVKVMKMISSYNVIRQSGFAATSLVQIRKHFSSSPWQL